MKVTKPSISFVAAVTSVEKESGGFGLREWLRVTAGDHEHRVTIRVPTYRARSYFIGRKMIVDVTLERK